MWNKYIAYTMESIMLESIFIPKFRFVNIKNM